MIYTGQRYGAKDDKGVRQSAAACTILSIIVSVILTIIGVAMCLGSCSFGCRRYRDPGAVAFISIVYGGIVMFVFLQMQNQYPRPLATAGCQRSFWRWHFVSTS